MSIHPNRTSGDFNHVTHTLVLSGGQLKVTIPRRVKPEDIAKAQSFLNWAIRKLADKADPPETFLQRLKRRWLPPKVDGRHYSP